MIILTGMCNAQTKQGNFTRWDTGGGRTLGLLKQQNILSRATKVL